MQLAELDPFTDLFVFLGPSTSQFHVSTMPAMLYICLYPNCNENVIIIILFSGINRCLMTEYHSNPIIHAVFSKTILSRNLIIWTTPVIVSLIEEYDSHRMCYIIYNYSRKEQYICVKVVV